MDPSYFTVFNGEVLFNGLDSGGQFGLWETNGKAAGTHELAGIAGAASSGLAPFDLTAPINTWPLSVTHNASLPLES
jgi:hypothetical protein